MSHPEIDYVKIGDEVTIDKIVYQFGPESKETFNTWLGQWAKHEDPPKGEWSIHLFTKDRTGGGRFSAQAIYNALVAQKK